MERFEDFDIDTDKLPDTVKGCDKMIAKLEYIMVHHRARWNKDEPLQVYHRDVIDHRAKLLDPQHEGVNEKTSGTVPRSSAQRGETVLSNWVIQHGGS